MTQPVFRSTDASAPALTHANGSLITVLDAILVNGYGSKASLGWSKAFSGTNKAVYQQGAGSSGFQLRVDDSGANVYEALVRGAEAFSDVDTISSGAFPTVAQYANGLFWNKATTTSATRAWVCWGDSKRFYFMPEVSSPVTDHGWNCHFFGDIASFKVGDSYNCMLIGRTVTNTAAYSDPFTEVTPSAFAAINIGHYLARSYTGVGTAIQCKKFVDGRVNGSVMGLGTPNSDILQYPDPVTGALQLSRVFIAEANPYSLRGYLPGVWCVCHNVASMGGMTTGVTFNGSDGLAGKAFELRKTITGGNGVSAFAIETSDWAES